MDRRFIADTYLTTIDISSGATWHQRNRYENTILLESNDDDDGQSGPMRARKILSPPHKISQFFEKNKEDRTSIFRRTREHAKPAR